MNVERWHEDMLEAIGLAHYWALYSDVSFIVQRKEPLAELSVFRGEWEYGNIVEKCEKRFCPATLAWDLTDCQDFSMYIYTIELCWVTTIKAMFLLLTKDLNGIQWP